MKRIDKVKKSVERCHGNIRESQVDNEVVGYSPHSSVSQNNPDHRDVPGDGHQDDQGVGYGPQSHLREQRRQARGCSMKNSDSNIFFPERLHL